MKQFQKNTMNAPLKKLNGRHRAFCALIVQGITRRDSAIEAGYSIKSASAMADNLMADPLIKKEIKRLGKEAAERAEIKTDQILAEYAAIGFLDPIELINEDGSMRPLADIPEHARRAIGAFKVTEKVDGSIVTEVRFVDKKGSLDSLAKIKSLFTPDKNDSGKGLAERVKLARERVKAMRKAEETALPAPAIDIEDISKAEEVEEVEEVEEIVAEPKPEEQPEPATSLNDRIKSGRERVKQEQAQQKQSSSAIKNNVVSDYQPLG
ncbi:terminase small subunit [Verrucomicrobia bacterium S94]|nr:terminase small subunit [Verrucomicrobia bacterium S94]